MFNSSDTTPYVLYIEAKFDITSRFSTGFGGAAVLAFLARGCLSVSESEPEMWLLELVSSSDMVSLLFGCDDDSPFALLALDLLLDLAFLTLSGQRFEWTYKIIVFHCCGHARHILVWVWVCMQHTPAAVFFIIFRWHILVSLAIGLHLLLVGLLLLLLFLLPRRPLRSRQLSFEDKNTIANKCAHLWTNA